MGVLDTFKDVVTLVQKADNIELNHKVLELQQQISGLLDENHKLRAEVRELAQKFELSDSLEFKDNMYWRTVDGQVDGPFCSNCFDAERKLLRLHTLPNRAQRCPACKQLAPGTVTPVAPQPRKVIARRPPWVNDY